MVGYLRSDVAAVEDEILHEINADAGANYSAQELTGVGAAVAAASAVTREVGIASGDTATANGFGAFLATYSQYADAVNQPHYLSLSGYHSTVGPAAEVRATSGRRNNVAAITQIKYEPNAGANFKDGSMMSLYRVPQFVIERQTLAAPVASVTFNNIPQGYESLQLHVYARGTVAALSDSVSITLNGDAVAANYNTQLLIGSAAVAGAVRSAADRGWIDIPAATEGANEFGGGTITFNQYSASDRHKHAIVLEGRNENSVQISSNRWEDTSPITDIVLTPVGGNFATGTVIELVGVMPSVEFQIEIDGVVEAAASTLNVDVPDNANDWIILDSSTNLTTPYSGAYQQTVSGVLQAWYAPIAIVANTGEAGTADAGTATTLDDAILTQANDFWNGAKLIIVTTTDTFAPQGESSVITDFDAALDRLTFGALTAIVDAGDTFTIDFGTLVDRSGIGNNARITWGVNPTGISVTLGSMVAASQPIIGGTEDVPARDILPPITVSDWFGDGTVSGSTLTNPIRPLITAMSDNTTLTEIQVWRLMGIIAVLFATVATAFTIRQHQGITAIVAGTMLGGLVAFDSNIFPMWTLVIATGLFIAGVVAERSPSL